MCVPEMCPIEYTNNPRIKPAKTGVGTGNVPLSESTTVSASAPVPIASAIYFFIINRKTNNDRPVKSIASISDEQLQKPFVDSSLLVIKVYLLSHSCPEEVSRL